MFIPGQLLWFTVQRENYILVLHLKTEKNFSSVYNFKTNKITNVWAGFLRAF
jgi:hypothetical protein